MNTNDLTAPKKTGVITEGILQGKEDAAKISEMAQGVTDGK